VLWIGTDGVGGVTVVVMLMVVEAVVLVVTLDVVVYR